ncbi:Rpn family recombination-promoting nuclease/putative transposase [Treponema zioleckii]|uniref:Rpn family recombination-promoting nuclease/putative transposase n=1 Tax=Treponema zioleckii TaxID=331680 RepID=UPI00168B251A|nr:Rpn family recombination-promoting nuclease/putative transposase [Treponema zioleckii]
MKATRREIKPVEELVFSDDFMFGAVMMDAEICKGVLERLLRIKIDHVEYPELQKSITPFYTKKGVRLDVYVADSDRVFDVECQSYKISNIGKRTRYYQSMLDIDSLMKGSDYSTLKESYILFICLDDPFNADLPIYTFERTCKEDERIDFNDQAHHIVFNASAYEKEDDAEIKEFLSFVKNNKAESDLTRRIANMVQTKKFEQSFVNEYMAWNLHDMDVRRQGRAEGRVEGRTEAARNALALGLSVAQVAKITGLTEEEIQNL